jgi:hypothetical protein
VASGSARQRYALLKPLKQAPFEDLGFAKVDFHRGCGRAQRKFYLWFRKNARTDRDILATMGKGSVETF